MYLLQYYQISQQKLSTILNKGTLILEGILTLVPLPTKSAPNSPMSRKFEFPTIYSKQLIQTFCSGEKFGTFFGNGTKVKIPSQIKPP